MSLATASIRARLIRSEIATSVGSTSIATSPALRIVSSWRCEALATRIATSLLAEHPDDIPVHGPFGQDEHADGPQTPGGLARQRQERQGRGRLGHDTRRHGVRPRSEGSGRDERRRNKRGSGEPRTKTQRGTVGTFRGHSMTHGQALEACEPRPGSTARAADPGAHDRTARLNLLGLGGLRWARRPSSVRRPSWFPPAWPHPSSRSARALGLADLLDVLLQDPARWSYHCLSPALGLMIRTSSA